MRENVDGRYEILRPLGGGGTAEVYLARDEHLGRTVALKLLREEHAGNEAFVERFRREARSAATLNHPNVVQVYDGRRSEDGRYFIAMEYVPGGTLKDRILREGPLDPGEAIRLASQVAEALQAAHEAGVVHRDVKSQNILLTTSGDAKVADFGIARAADATTISRPGAVLGTAKYMSPEQATGSVATPKSDLYSLGIVLYEMLTGGLPFEGGTPADVRARHVAERPPHPRDANPGVPEALDALVVRLLAKDPEGRLRNAAQLVEELGRLRDRPRPVEDAPAQPATRPTRAPSPPAHAGAGPRRGGPVWVPAILIALLVLAGVGALGIWGNSAQGGALEALGGASERAREAVQGFERALSGTVEVPDVEGLAERAARGRLEAVGLGAEVQSRDSSEGDAGRVLEQSVPGGEEVEEGSKVLLAVGDGPRNEGPPDKGTRDGAPDNGGVPDLVGLSYLEAERALKEAGFALGGVEEASSETAPAGVIVGQDPSAGSAAAPGSLVFLKTSTGGAGGAPSSAPASASSSASASAPSSTSTSAAPR